MTQAYYKLTLFFLYASSASCNLLYSMEEDIVQQQYNEILPAELWCAIVEYIPANTKFFNELIRCIQVTSSLYDKVAQAFVMATEQHPQHHTLDSITKKYFNAQSSSLEPRLLCKAMQTAFLRFIHHNPLYEHLAYNNNDAQEVNESKAVQAINKYLENTGRMRQYFVGRNGSITVNQDKLAQLTPPELHDLSLQVQDILKVLRINRLLAHTLYNEQYNQAWFNMGDKKLKTVNKTYLVGCIAIFLLSTYLFYNSITNKAYDKITGYIVPLFIWLKLGLFDKMAFDTSSNQWYYASTKRAMLLRKYAIELKVLLDNYNRLYTDLYNATS